MSKAERHQIEGEEKVLGIGYFALMAERDPFNKKPGDCLSGSSAVFLEEEKEHIAMPTALSFNALKATIHPDHRDRMEKIWEKVEESKMKLGRSQRTLEKKWRDKPTNVRDASAHEELRTTKVYIRRKLRGVVKAIIGKAYTDSPLEEWQHTEKSLRETFYKEHKIYILALRLYYEMLLEKPPTEDKEWVLSVDHPERNNIAKRIRHLRVIDMVHQGISAAKAAHDQQATGRIRKTERVPYLFHITGVIGQILIDVIPYIIDEEKLPIDPMILIATGAMHDTREDTRLTIERAIEFLKEIANKCDSRIHQNIESGYERDPNEVKERVLNLVKKTHSGPLKKILRILSKNTELTDAETVCALKQNIAGTKKTREILGKTWKFKKLQEPSQTFTNFPESHEDKLDAFLVRLNAITTTTHSVGTGQEKNETLETNYENQQIALIVKCADRTHNTSTLKGSTPEHQQKTLRSTVTRLIAWCMLDFNQTKYPLYNALPRLIDTTREAYKAFAKEHTDLMTDADRRYMSQLEQWAREVQRLPIQRKITDTITLYNTGITKRPPSNSVASLWEDYHNKAIKAAKTIQPSAVQHR